VAREKNAAVTALAAAAALAPVSTLPEAGPGVEMEERATEGRGPTEHPDCETQIAELTAALDEERRRVVELEAALIEARAEVRYQRASFDRAWSDREAQLSPERVAPPPSAPTPGTARRLRAVGSVRCYRNSTPILLEDGAEIPEGVDLATMPPGTFEEV